MVVPQTIQRLLTGDCNDRNDGRGRCVERNGELFWCCADEDYAEYDYEAGILRCTTGRDSPAPSQTSPDTTAPPNFNSRDEAARPLPETPDATYCLNVIQRAKAKSGSRWMQSISVFDANRCRREVSAQRRHDGF